MVARQPGKGTISRRCSLCGCGGGGIVFRMNAPNDYISLEKLLPGEWKKSHPESHSMVHHTTEAEYMAAILKSRAKRKESEEEASKGESK